MDARRSPAILVLVASARCPGAQQGNRRHRRASAWRAPRDNTISGGARSRTRKRVRTRDAGDAALGWVQAGRAAERARDRRVADDGELADGAAAGLAPPGRRRSLRDKRCWRPRASAPPRPSPAAPARSFRADRCKHTSPFAHESMEARWRDRLLPNLLDRSHKFSSVPVDPFDGRVVPGGQDGACHGSTSPTQCQEP